MKISFVIPAYNEEDFLDACLQSIFADHKTSNHQIEVIVVNNASTDNTRKVAESYPNVIVVDETQKGITFARQAGFVASTGELIANVDADTILPYGWINTVIKQFEKNPRLIALSGPHIYHDLSVSANLLIRFYYYIGYASYLINRFVLRVGSLVQGGNFVIKRSALEAINGFNTNFSFFGEDTDIAKRLHPIGPVKFTLKLPIHTSGRRLKAEGFLTMGWKYPINYIWTIAFKKPFHTAYSDFRDTSKTQNFKTSINKLESALNFIKLGLITCLVLIVSSIASVYYKVSQLPVVSVAQAEHSDSYMVRKFGPTVIKINQRIDKLSADTDDN